MQQHGFIASTRWATLGAGFAVVEKDGVQIAWTGCTVFVNSGIVKMAGELSSREGQSMESHTTKQASECYSPNPPVVCELSDKEQAGLQLIQEQVMFCNMEQSPADNEFLKLVKLLSSQYGAVIVTPHWNDIYNGEVSAKQQNFAKQILDSGAVAIAGTHPHVLQKWSSTLRPGKVVLYSTGNLVSSQSESENSWKERCPQLTAQYAEAGAMTRGLTSKECKESLSSTAIFYLGIKVPRKPRSNRATATCLSYVETRWESNSNREGMFLRDSDPNSTALKIYGPDHRVTISEQSFKEAVHCIPV